VSDNQYFKRMVRCPECEGLTEIDINFSEAICSLCGETFYDETEEEGFEDSEWDDDRDDEIGCLYPGKCVMSFEHFVSECHTAEEIDDAEEE
jgi:hypothetical protein